ncbi:MAG: PKD domain-containing protein, partial [Anaerolineae bacterium]|nr:PKD domain-containing protein [Anaerolineae bacterium]
FTDTWTFTVDSTAPAAPVLVAPANGAFISDTTPSLTWQASPDPDVAGYRLDWNGTLIDVGNTTTYATPVLADGVYTWTVAAYDGVHNTSAFTDTWTFTVDATPPATPVLVFPEDASVISDTLPALTWEAVTTPDTAGYLLDWNGTVLDVGLTTTYTTSLLADGEYQWTVAAYDTLHNVGAFAATWSFRVDTKTPTPPVLATPPDGTLTDDTTPTFTWSASPDSDVLGYLFKRNGTIVDVPGGTTAYTSGPLSDGIYTWTVAAYDTLYTSAFTDAWQITIDTTPPTPPALESPTNGVILSDTTPTLMWRASPTPDTAGYLLNLGGAITDLGDTTQYIPVLAPGTYTWTVAAYDPLGNTSVYTDVWTFWIQESISGLDAGNDSPTALGNATNLIATIETGTDVSYTWALGDGDMASGPNVAHIYPAPGSYTAVVTASNGINAVTATTTITIQESIAGLVAENDSPTLLGDPTNLTATITAGTDVTYVWDLGDGNFATGPVVAHTYAAIGNYTAIVTASNEVSVMTAATTIDVNDVPIAGLVAGNDGPTPLGILTNLTATVAEGTNVIYTWTFGDEEMYDLRRTNTPSGVVLEEMVSHLYPTMGAYTAVVTASNSVNFVTATTTVEITPGCVAQLNNGPTRYDTVQAAVDASTQATDVVKVAGVCSDINTRGGTQQIVYLTKTIELRGGYRADFGARDPIAYPTTLDAASAGRALLITGNIAPRIESFHITNGFYDGANGGGIYVLNAHPTISDCQITNNMAMGLGLNVGRGGGIAISAGSDVLLYNNQISNNTAQYHGGGLYAHNGSHGLTISANTFTGNIAGGYGGAMMLNSSDDATIEQNLIASNTATQRAGGLAFSGQHLTLHENVIRHNEVSEGDGGGIYLGPSGEGSLINNIIAGNIIQTTGNGAGMALQSFNVAMLHNTIAGNQGGNGQGVYINNADLDAMNTILAGHAVGLDIDVTSDVTIESTLWGTGAWANGADVQIVPGSTVLTGTVNIWEDPVFVDAPGGDYHLSPGSGAIEAGIDSEVAHDIDGDARPLGLRYDIGADEYRHINDPITGLTAINNSPTPLGNTTQFSASVETGTGISYTWDFGDGATGTGATVTHAYTTIGRYTAVVTAANTVNITTTTTEVIIEDAAITGLAINTNSPNALGDPTTFEAVITTGSNVVYAWTFGDGATGAGAQTAHTYAVPDYYTVVVTATNGVSEVSVTTRVHVYQKLVLLPGGGAVTTFDGRLAFAAPVELGETLVISYTPRLAPAHAAGALTYAGFAFDLSAWNTLGNPVTTFAPPLNLTLHYDSAQIPAPLGEQTINLYYWNGLWAPVALQTRNLDADTLTLALANTGEFALLGEDAYRIYLPLLMYNQAR